MTAMLPIANPVWANARATPHRVVLYADSARWTAREFADEVSGRARHVADQGIRAGDAVLVQADDSLATFWTVHALWWLGATAVMASPWSTADALQRTRDEVNATAVLQPDALTCSSGSVEPEPWIADRRLAVLATSGSHGPATLVPLTVDRAVFAAMGSAQRLGHHLDDAWLCCLPTWHVGGLSILIRTAVLGTAVVWVDGWNADAVHETIESLPVTQLSVVPQMLRALVARRDGAPFPSRLRWALVGGAASSSSDLEAAEALGLTALPTWGMTESAAQLATRPPTEPLRPGVVGPPMAFARVAAFDGRLHAGGPQMGQSPADAERPGWVPTTDAGEVDDAGWVRVTGRLTGAFKSGGEWVQPDVTQTTLTTRNPIQRAFCAGVANARWGTALLAWVDPSDVDPRTLNPWSPALADLAPPQRPRIWVYAPLEFDGLKLTASDRDAALARLRKRLQAALEQASDEGGIAVGGTERGQIDEGVYVFDARQLDAVWALHPELQRDASSIVLLDVDRD